MPTVTCYTCGKAFHKRQYAVKEHNFCNRRCFGIWRASAEWSGANNPAWRGGSEKYRGGNWHAQRAAARQRDGYTCQHCGIHGRSLPVHHIKPFHLFDDYHEANRLDNLITLCPACHSKTDNEFWLSNADLMTSRRVPDFAPAPKSCRECGDTFVPRSPATLVCDNCCNTTCVHCGQPFYSRKATIRRVKYCSRECRNAAIKRPPQICEGCGITYQPDRKGTHFCSHACRMKHDQPYKHRRIFRQSPDEPTPR